MSVEINNESGVGVDELALVELSRFLLDSLEIDPLAELSIVLLDATGMSALHEQWMDSPGPTDVMAFPMDGADGPPDPGEQHGPSGVDTDEMLPMLGDVVLCPEVAAEQARSAGHSTESELLLLCTHGILHLLGYDHADEETEREMFELQAKLVRAYTDASGRERVRAPLPGTRGEVRDTAAARDHGRRDPR